MQALFPIWKRDTRELIATFLAQDFRSITCCIDTRKLGDAFVGREIDKQFLSELPPDVDPCGENGEFHSFACGGPLFANSIAVRTGDTVRRDSFLFCDLLPI
jgi:diphthamide synthase (EF-2-diphthine--ammonia ligase)